MNQIIIDNNPRRFYLPHLGQRIVKTGIAVFICLIIYSLLGYRGSSMPTESIITAIICLQPYIKDSRASAWVRMSGSIIGGALGLLFLLFLTVFPALGKNLPLLYAFMGLGIMLSLYVPVVLRMADASGISSIVFICVVIAFPEVDQPLRQSIIRIVDVFIGNSVAILLNVIRLPRKKNKDLVFFIHSKDLVPDNYSQMSSGALFRLNSLNDDGARICLMSEHAPAFFLLQMRETQLYMPVIVMDGAAIFDLRENVYLAKHTIPASAAKALRDFLDEMNIGYFVYTIHQNNTHIFHQGALNSHEEKIMRQMQHSHYRYYLEDELYDHAEIIYIKIVISREEETHYLALLSGILKSNGLRIVSRHQISAEDAAGLYIYAENATMENAASVLMDILREKDPSLKSIEVRLRNGYQSDTDAIHLMSRVARTYEPVSIPFLERHLPVKGNLPV